MNRWWQQSERFRSVLRREVTRFWSIRRQTILAPILETYLYISIFGAALGSRIQQLDGHPYIVFIIPGLLMMTFAMNSFSNNSSTILQQKIQRAIDDQLASPVSNFELMSAYTLGGFLRGALVTTIVFITASFLVDLPMAHPVLFVGSLVIIALFFALLGVLVGVMAEAFDNISFYQQFVITPLIFLGGVFYSAALLPQWAQTVTHFNPIYYMINTVRYGMLGQGAVDPWLALSIISAVTVVLFVVVLRIFQSGYKLRV